MTTKRSTEQSGTGGQPAALLPRADEAQGQQHQERQRKSGMWYLRGVEEHQGGCSMTEMGQPRSRGRDSRPGRARPRCVLGPKTPWGRVVRGGTGQVSYRADGAAVGEAWSVSNALASVTRPTGIAWAGEMQRPIASVMTDFRKGL